LSILFYIATDEQKRNVLKCLVPWVNRASTLGKSFVALFDAIKQPAQQPLLLPILSECLHNPNIRPQVNSFKLIYFFQIKIK
jgi:hypothetical protein